MVKIVLPDIAYSIFLVNILQTLSVSFRFKEMYPIYFKIVLLVSFSVQTN